MIQIKNAKLYKELAKVGLGDVLLYRDNGYFFVASDNDEVADKIASMRESIIYMNSFQQQSIKEWVKDIVSLFDAIED